MDGTKTSGGKDPLLDDMPMSTACAPKSSRQSRSKSYLETHMPVESDHVDLYTEEGESDPDAADSVFEADDGVESERAAIQNSVRNLLKNMVTEICQPS